MEHHQSFFMGRLKLTFDWAMLSSSQTVNVITGGYLFLGQDVICHDAPDAARTQWWVCPLARPTAEQIRGLGNSRCGFIGAAVGDVNPMGNLMSLSHRRTDKMSLSHTRTD